MAKKNKKLGLKIGIAVLAFVSVSLTLGLINAETGMFTKMFAEEHDTNGRFEISLPTTLVSKDATKDFTQEVEVSDENSPFEKYEVNVKVYNDEDTTARLNVAEGVATASYVEEVEIVLTLADDVEYYMGTFAFDGFGFADSDAEEELEISVKVGKTTYDCVSYSETIMFLNDVPVSDDVVITINNPYASEEKIEAHEFTIGTILINNLDATAYAPETEE